MGHIQKNSRQNTFFQLNKNRWNHNYSHGGVLRNKRKGRGRRPLSTKDPHHVVYKLDKLRLRHGSLRSPQCLTLATKILKKYALHFFVHIEQVSIQKDHIHLLIRTKRRSQFHHFMRVTAGQIAQQFEREGFFTGKKPSLSQNVTDTQKTPNTQKTPKKASKEWNKKTSLWIYRPFSRIVKGFKAYKIVRNYIQLNEQEAKGKIPYRKERLRGMTIQDWQILWTS